MGRVVPEMPKAPSGEGELMKSISSATCDYCGRQSIEIQCVICGGDTPGNMIYHTTRANDMAMSVAEIYKVSRQ